MTSVILEGVTKEYPGAVTAVRDLNLAIEDHEFVAIVGPSGCGKTTTLRLIAGLERVTSGQIRIGDSEVNKKSPRDRNIAMVFQSFALYPHWSVYKNMAFGLHLRYGGGLANRILGRLIRPARAAKVAALRKGIKQQVQQAARLLGIEHLLSRLPRHLSGGERQRVALGRAIVRDPAAFLFDEPFSNLDAKLRTEMRSELKRLHDKLKTTIVYVTHDQAEAMTLGQRIIVMANGRIQQVGPPKEVYARPRNRFVAEFIGSPSMNLITGRLTAENDGWRLDGEGVSLSLRESPKEFEKFAEQTVTVGVRPEHVEMHSSTSTNTARIVSVESLGDTEFAYVRGGGETEKTMVSKISSEPGPCIGDAVELQVAGRHAHFFDPQSGNDVFHERN